LHFRLLIESVIYFCHWYYSQYFFMSIHQSPFILYSDGEGNIFEDSSLYATGRSGWDAFAVPLEEWIDLPDGGNLSLVGIHRTHGSRPSASSLCEPTQYLGEYLVGA
jgi:hypothetical protein